MKDRQKAKPLCECKKQIKMLKDQLNAVLNWPNPEGTIKEFYIPPWMAEDCAAVIKKCGDEK